MWYFQIDVAAGAAAFFSSLLLFQPVLREYNLFIRLLLLLFFSLTVLACFTWIQSICKVAAAAFSLSYGSSLFYVNAVYL